MPALAQDVKPQRSSPHARVARGRIHTTFCLRASLGVVLRLRLNVFLLIMLNSSRAVACPVGEHSDPFLTGLFSVGPALVAFLVSAWSLRRWQKKAQSRRLALALLLGVPLGSALLVFLLAVTLMPFCAFCRPKPHAATAPAPSVAPDYVPFANAPRKQPSSTTYRVVGDEHLSRRPVVVIFQGTPQSGYREGVVVPAFALFDDRSVIARRGHDVVEGKLEESVYKRLREEVDKSGVMNLAPESFPGIPAFDASTTAILVRKNDRYKRVEVAGFGDGIMDAWAEHKPPASFLAIYQRLTKLAIPEAKPWEARHVLIRLRRREGEGAPWPAKLPRPGSRSLFYGTDVEYVVTLEVAALRPSLVKRARRNDLKAALRDVLDRKEREQAGKRTDLPNHRAVGGKIEESFAWRGGAYSVLSVYHAVEAHNFIVRVNRCARPDVSRTHRTFCADMKSSAE